MEYLPDPQEMNSVTYSPERMEKAIMSMRQVHRALIEHVDSYPKNILIIPGNPGRVMWIDFDVAITYPDETYIGEQEQELLDFETEVVESFGSNLLGFQPQPSI